MKRIVLCLDGSLESDKASRFLARMVHGEPYELVVLSILPKPVEPVDECRDLKHQRAYLQDAYTTVQQCFSGANVELRQLFRFGHPGQKIVSVAKALQADLIVLGAVGHSMIARMLLGSTSDYVATHAHCSVLVVRPCDATSKHPEKPNLNLALAYAPTGPARAAFEEITEFQWGSQTQFDLLTVVPDLIELNKDGAAFSRTQRERAQSCIDELRDELRDVAPFNVGYLLENNHAGDAIVGFAEAHDTDLLIVGESEQLTASRVLLGSVSRFVLRHAPCSVWVTRNRKIEGIRKPLDRKSTHTTDMPALQ